MSLNVNDQLHVLYDLLSEQSEDCCGSVSECQQIKRLVQSLISNESVNNQELQQLLPEIYNYGRKGEIAQNLEEHISTNQQNLKTWVDVIHYTTE
ncbi:YtzH-like family protein [Aquibacillus koreensis]|uniref:YtzH-like family protein n=1 Tax=Aquibacillus koreensis TaxID=279446 RepID=A0A9X4AGQ9_9BACI|nr:YtzH-like family protein [Aquibacillus koreensis]MCT2535030.1 YtzH-like family protein [Aquibacillus koreensis]MDC3419317.1 YtzH-like family protein [Aquibacillus koreensis]